MAKPPRNPIWSRDELTLALDLYVKTGGNPTAKDDVAIEALSAVLNKMHRLNGGGGSDTLRNRNGVYLKVMNFRSSDPVYLDQGKVGMQRGNRLERVLWAEYYGRLADLATDAEAIRQAVIGVDEAALAKLPPVEPYEGEEGGVIMRLHKRYERDPKLVRQKRKAAAAAGLLACEVCGFDFERAYGELGAGYIEVHHTKPVHTLKPGTLTKLADLALLCANCHRMAHRQRNALSLPALQQKYLASEREHYD
ncbi:HNH endonuclease [Sphingomonas sp. A2-49]|uniref:HNH endonuclease n=1 Tax=Sphingomonas sp. A2-49 TaxID=1391375 RepID=UPI0021D06B8F|nr:HNH endonuclease [Sphingomonas sp. A2-49]MCU6453988.1 HNH endonuclease [Sphingomonas sp. A2-49]